MRFRTTRVRRTAAEGAEGALRTFSASSRARSGFRRKSAPDANSGDGGSGFGPTTMAGTATAPGNASDPRRGTAGDAGKPGRVLLTM